MNFDAMEQMCDRALQYTFCKKKLLLTAATLSLSGLLVVFSMGLSLSANVWVSLSLSFLPLFISSGILIALGVILIRAYHDEVKARDFHYSHLLADSWEVALAASYFFMPVILLYLLMWMMLGLFFLLREIPFVGEFFGVVFAFGPFLLLLGSFTLLLLSIFMLFALTPVLALKDFVRSHLVKNALALAREKVFQRIIFLFIALIPLVVAATLLVVSAKMTTLVYMVQESHVQMILQWFIIMLPFSIILSFPVIFFFNMAAESHIAIQKAMRKE
jgi:hypothetical protein